MKNHTSSIRVYFDLLKIDIFRRMSYRGDFLISILIMFLFDFLTPFVTILIYRSGASFPGWSFYEVMLIQGIFMLAKGIAFPLFFGMVWNTLLSIRQGTFDLLLIKPRSVLLLNLAMGVDSEDFGKLIGGIVLVGYVFTKIPVPGLLQIIQGLFLFFISLVILLSFALIISSSLFVWIGNSRILEIFDIVALFGQFPISIYSKAFQNIITFVIPIAMIAFFPAKVLLRNFSIDIVYSMAVSILFLILSIFIWNKMILRYTSAGG